jgi:hypothetical protein
MAKLLVEGQAWLALETLAFHYCTSAWKPYIVTDGKYTPIDNYSPESCIQQRLSSYKVLARMLGIPDEYLTDSRYPSNDYSLDKRIHLPGVGFVRFIVHPVRQAPNGAGFLRFYVECPACGKKYPVGRMHQHVRGHQKRATLLHASYYINDQNERVSTYMYRLKRWARYNVAGYSYHHYSKDVRVEVVKNGCALVYVHHVTPREDKHIQLDIVGEDAQDAIDKLLEAQGN